jgi:S1-C subfamily serine protease
VIVSTGSEGERGLYVQTDAAINWQNAGGPVVTLRGELVAVASAAVTEQRGLPSIGYAARLDGIASVIATIDAGDTVAVRPFAAVASALRGMTVGDVDAAVRARYRVPEELDYGAVITGIEAASPAALVGLEVGDVLVEIDMVPLVDATAFASAAAVDGPLLVLVLRESTPFFVVLAP